MAAFKKGDWVRVTCAQMVAHWNTYWSRRAGYQAELGSVFRIAKAMPGAMSDRDGCFEVSAGSVEHGPWWCGDQIEPWQPKVGERVRTTSGGDEEYIGVEGVVEHNDGATCRNLCIRLDKPIEKWGDTSIWRSADHLEPIIDAPVAEQPAALKIEAGKFYKTRDGRKVGPADTNAENFNVGMDFFGREAAAVIPEIGDVDASGFWLCGDGNSDHDLIAEWHESTPTTITAAQVDTIADEYGPVVREVPVAAQQARFKVGDWVTKEEWASPEGWEVARVTEKQIALRVVGYSEPVTYTLPDDDFILVKAATPAIVCKLDKGQPLPAHRPHVHATVEAADKEAARLAELHTGQEFGVFALTGAPHRVAKVYEHEWQRLAAAGEKVQAIKALREITGMGLKPTKDAVEYFLAAA